MKLTAQYKVPLTGFLMFCLDEHSLNTISFNISVDEYSIKIAPEIDKSHTYKQEGNEHPTYGANILIVSITKEVEGTIDEIRKKAWPIVEGFEQAAETAINRLISFFQYQLNIPLLKKVNSHDDPWSNLPKLEDENGKVIDLDLYTDDYSRHFAYGFFPAFVMKSLCNLEDQALIKALNNPTPPKLH